MNKFWLVVLVAGMVSCNEAAEVKKEADSLVTKADSLVKKIDSLKIMDSIREKGGRLWDSTKSKGGRLVETVEEKFNDTKKKDSSHK